MGEFTQKYIKPDLSLFDNQKRNVKALIHKRRCVLSDKAGAGKTCSCLYAFSYLKEKGYMSNLFVLTPLSAYEKKVWEKDINKFFNFTYIDIEKFNKLAENSTERVTTLLSKFDVIYAKHSNIKQAQFSWLFKALAISKGVLWVIDEVHDLRNPNSSMHKLYRNLTRTVPALWGITATAISRNVENLYNIVNLVYPWYLGTWSAFRDTYCLTQTKVIGYDRVNKRKKKAIEAVGIKYPEALRARLEPIFISGESFLHVNFKYIDYDLSAEEQDLYTKIANGLTIQPEQDPSEWFKWLMDSEVKQPTKSIGNVERYSNRFIYLQLAADGIIAKDTTYSRKDSIKMARLISLLKEITEKGQSVLVYFDYLASVEIAKSLIESSLSHVRVLLSTGEDRLKEGLLTESRVKQVPHIVLCTRASSASVSYYFINNVIFFHNPTIPSVFVQFVGRITRKNTLYPNDLNCYIFRSNNVDLYKYLVCVEKTVLQEQATGEKEATVPEDYKLEVLQQGFRERMKKLLLWQDS